MELPEFNGSGVGPQGSGGIPPEQWRREAAEQGKDLSGQGLQPEDGDGAQGVLGREASEVMKQLGVQEPNDGTPEPSGTDPEPQAKAAPSTKEEPAPAETKPEGDLDSRVRKLVDRYGNDIGELAKAHVNLDRQKSRALQDKDETIGKLQQDVATNNAMLQELLTKGIPTRAATPGRPAEETSQNGEGIDDDYFRENPAVAVRQIFREEMTAYQVAQANVAEQERLRQTEQEHAQEIEQLRPLMADLYMKNRDIYDQMTPRRALTDLLERARDRDTAHRGLSFYQQVRGEMDTPANGTATPASSPGSLPIGTGSSGRRAAPAGPPGGNWSQTKAMQRLKGRSDGSVDESRGLMDVLAERGFGEHLG